MASSSPYQNNDYQAISTYRPYKLPINDIFKANNALNAYWDEGARKVKNVYNTALDLRLSLAPNQEIRDKFIKESERELAKLSTMNLADPSVQRQGIGIYKPLFQDEGIMSDSQATAHIDKVNTEALSFRTKDGGKFYSMDNHQYALSGSDEFKNSTDRMAGKAYLQKRKEYEPYYDYTDDMDQALKTCGKSSTTTESPTYANKKMTGYSHHQEIKGLSAAQARVCLEGSMPPKGYRQLQIEGAVRYKNQPDVLAADTQAYLSGVSENFADELQKISAAKMNIRDNKEIPEADKPAMIEALEQKAKTVSAEIKNNGATIDKLKNKDYSELMANYDAYAGSIYTYRKLYKKALGASYQDLVSKQIADPVQLTYIKHELDKETKAIDFNYDVALSDRQFQQQKVIEMIRLAGKGKGPNGELDPEENDAVIPDGNGGYTIKPGLMPVTNNLGETPETNTEAYAELNQKLAKINTDAAANDNLLYNKIISKAETNEKFKEDLLKGFGGDLTWQQFKDRTKSNRFFERKSGSPIKIHDTTWFKDYFKGHKEDEDLNRWSAGTQEAQLAAKTMNMKLEAVNNQVFNNLKNLVPGARNYDELVAGTAKNMTTYIGGKLVTGADIINAQQGKVVPGISPQTSKSALVGNMTLDPNMKVFKLDAFADDSKENQQMIQFAKKVNSKFGDNLKKIEKERSKVMNETGWLREKWTHTPDEKSSMIVGIRNHFSTVDNEGKVSENKSITVLQSDFNGNVRISHPGVTEGDIDRYRTVVGVGTGAAIVAPGVVELTGTKYNVIPKAIDSPALKEAAYQLSTLSETRDYRLAEPGQEVSNQRINVDTRIGGVRRTATIRVYKGADMQPEYTVHIEGSTSDGPQIKASSSYELFEKLSLLSQKQGVEFKPK